MVKVRVGCMGWSYDDWVGPFYPPGTPPGDYLERYARVFDTVEVDSSHYSAPSRETVARWAHVAPRGFEFAVKFPGAITHDARLRDVAEPLERFLGTLHPLAVANKLGPLLAQFPPSFERDGNSEALFDFFDAVPRRFRLAVELRHDSWWTPDVFRALEARGAALVWSVIPRTKPPPRATSDLLYVRFVGDRALTRFDRVQRDRRDDMVAMKRHLEAEGLSAMEVYFFLNNHFMGFAPETARILQEIMGMPQADLTKARVERGQKQLGEF